MTQAAQAQKLAYARHGTAYDPLTGPFAATFLFADAACSKRLGWQAGSLSSGDLWDAFTVSLVPAARASQVAA